MASGSNADFRLAKLEAELDAERRRSTQLDQAYRNQLDSNRMLVTENATLKADLRTFNETTVPDLQRRLKKVEDELSEERTKLVKHLRNEVRTARNRETIAMIGGRNGVKRELAEREEDRRNDEAPAVEGPQANVVVNVDDLVNAINAIADPGGPPVPLEPAHEKHENITEAYAPANEPTMISCPMNMPATSRDRYLHRLRHVIGFRGRSRVPA